MIPLDLAENPWPWIRSTVPSARELPSLSLLNPLKGLLMMDYVCHLSVDGTAVGLSVTDAIEPLLVESTR